MTDGEPMSPQDRDLWEYFATLYKNSNKGIKGRGKDRRITPSSKTGQGMGSRASLDLQGSKGNVKVRRGGGYEDSSTYTGSTSNDEDDTDGCCVDRRRQ